MSDSGQYFTNREMCDFAVELSTGGNLNFPDSVCDPFCGTGGFFISYIKRVNSYGDNKEKYWEKNIQKIYGNDIKKGNVMSTMLNLLCYTGVPSINETITQRGSFLLYSLTRPTVEIKKWGKV